ncbi:MAG: glycosyltransferase family 2 protein [Pseudomonadota bacterium]
MPRPSDTDPAEITVIMVSYKTRDLTLKALETLHNTTKTAFKTILFDNASGDGTAEAVTAQFPDVDVIASPENLGFAKANNLAAGRADTEWLLLLNPDTECHEGAVDNLLAFSKSHPKAGITGGRTVFPDGSLNIASCWMRMTPWSTFCNATGLRALFPKSEFFNSEAMGAWPRDSVREVDIVVGCFLMLRRTLWQRLGGFDPRYFMYGEEADLCLRAKALGYRPMITPDAQIMHLVGASSGSARVKHAVMVAKARMTLIEDHWPRPAIAFGRAMMTLWAGLRAYGLGALTRTTGQKKDAAKTWRGIWAERANWRQGY